VRVEEDERALVLEVLEGKAVDAIRPVCQLLSSYEYTQRAYQDRWPSYADDEHDYQDLTKEEPPNTRDRHDTPPEHWRGVITCILFCWQWVEEKDIAKDEENERYATEHLCQPEFST
jgi:hypothetical protein